MDGIDCLVPLFADEAEAITNLTVAWIGVAGSVIVALISAGVSAWSLITSRKNAKQLADYQTRLDERKTRHAARVDYEYEARQRLYKECEPLLFQFGELIEYGRGRIFSLSRSARRGELDPPNNFLGGPGYYLESTMYSLLVPITVYTLLQRRLTFLDFSLEPMIRLQYEVLRLLYLSFTEDFELARRDPALKYDPNNPDWQSLRAKDEKVYWRQGIPFGRQDAALNSLIVTSDKAPSRYVTFGEFETGFRTAGSQIENRFQYIADVFLEFHPQRRPVLWRILLVQLYYYEVLRGLHTMDFIVQKVTLDELVVIEKELEQKLDWRNSGSGIPDADFQEPLNVARDFVKEQLRPFVTPDMFKVSLPASGLESRNR